MIIWAIFRPFCTFLDNFGTIFEKCVDVLGSSLHQVAILLLIGGVVLLIYKHAKEQSLDCSKIYVPKGSGP